MIIIHVLNDQVSETLLERLRPRHPSVRKSRACRRPLGKPDSAGPDRLARHQALTLAKLRVLIREAIELCLEVEDDAVEPLDFVGVEKMSRAD